MGGPAWGQDQLVAQPRPWPLKRTSEGIAPRVQHFLHTAEETEAQRGDKIHPGPLVPGVGALPMTTLPGQERGQACLAEPVA